MLGFGPGRAYRSSSSRRFTCRPPLALLLILITSATFVRRVQTAPLAAGRPMVLRRTGELILAEVYGALPQRCQTSREARRVPSPGAIEPRRMTGDPREARMNCVYPISASPRSLRVPPTCWEGVASWWRADSVRQIIRASGARRLELLPDVLRPVRAIEICRGSSVSSPSYQAPCSRSASTLSASPSSGG